MPVLMRVIAFANGADCPIAGQYLKGFDHEAFHGRGYGTFTLNPKEAMKFNDFVEAMAFWKKTSECKPIRADGQPNRPLTSTTVTIDQFFDT